MNKNYEISVVTPFHNVDLNIFKNGFESMIRQTIGFGNVEWIIVVHNSDDSYAKALYEMSADYPNIIIRELHNDKRTPSSPRNYGLKMATGRYVGFLDGDDSYLPDCLEKVLIEIKREKAQIACFRREFELETQDSIPITETVLWNQTYDKIVIDRDNWDDEKMFSGICGMVTSRIYDRLFLEENNITFDESVLFGEDYLFNLESYGHAKKILYLPQLIGYHYFINGGSLVQNSKKSPETLIAYAKGYVKIFEAGLKNGFYMNSIISRLCVVLSRYLVANNELSLSDRNEIKKLLEPYILKTTYLHESKIYSNKIVQESYDVPREVILKPENWMSDKAQNLLADVYEDMNYGQNPMLVELMGILGQNSDTDIGQRYNFANIMTVNGYQSKVPKSDNEYYAKLISLTTRIGESKIFTNSQIQYYSKSESPMGREIMYPQTREMVRDYGKALDKMLGDKRNFIMFESLPKIVKYNDKARMNSLYGIALSECVTMRRNTGRRPISTTSPMEMLFPIKELDTMVSRDIIALFDGNIEQIVAPSTWHVLNMFQYIKQHKNGNKKKSPFLQSLISENPERARQLDEILEEEFDKNTIKKIWPKLDKIYADGNGIYEIYTEKLSEYIDMSMLSDGYLIEDFGVVGKAVEGRAGCYELNMSAGFFEFDLPFASAEDETVSIEDVKPGGVYEIVISNKAGLYRYRTGYMIKIVENTKDRLLFEKHHRKEWCVSFDAENGKQVVINDYDMSKAVKEIEQIYKILVYDYCYGDVSIISGSKNVHLAIILEPSSIESERKDLLETNIGDLKNSFETYLCRNVDGFENAIDNGLVEVEVQIREPETHLLYRDLSRYANDLLQDQLKPVRVLNTPKKMSFFYRKHS